MVEFLGIPYAEYIGSFAAIIALFFIIFYLLRQGGWSRPKEEKEEIRQERALLKDTIKEKALQVKEKWTIRKLIREFKSLIGNYNLVYTHTDSTARRLEVSLSPSEIFKVLIALFKLLENMQKENVPVKAEESSFKNFLKWWPIANKEIVAWTYKAKEGQDSLMQKALSDARLNVFRINSLAAELGAQLGQEETLDENRRKEILKLYQEVNAEEGKAA